VLEANGKVNWIGEISHPSPSQTLGPIWMQLQMYHYIPLGVDVQNLVTIDLAVAALRMREKRGFLWGFLFTYPSVYPLFTTPTGQIFSTTLTLNGSYDVFLQPLVPFGGRDEIAPIQGSNPPKPPFCGREQAFSLSQTREMEKHSINQGSAPPLTSSKMGIKFGNLSSFGQF